MNITDPEAIARAFHEAYERLAPEHGYETRKASAVPWEQVPENNRRLMTAVAAEVAPLIAAQALRSAEEGEEWALVYRLDGVEKEAGSGGHVFDSRRDAQLHIDTWRSLYPSMSYTDVRFVRRSTWTGPWENAGAEGECCAAPNYVWEHSRAGKDHFRCVGCGGGMTKARAT